MKQVLLLGSKDFGEKNDISALANRCAEKLRPDVTLGKVFFEDLLFHISNAERSITDARGEPLHADLIIAVNWYKPALRDIAYTLALYAEEKNIPVWNSEMGAQRSTTKLSAIWLLSQMGVAIPDTFFSLDRGALKRAVDDDKYIIKDISGSRGRNNYLINTAGELDKVLNSSPSARYMLQEYIPNDYDLRVTCFGGEPSLVIKRQRSSNDTHLNNTSQGARATLLPLSELPNETMEASRKIARQMKREIAGIDYVVANDGSSRYICLEVNAIPQLTSGAFTEEKMDAMTASIARKLKG